MDRGFIRDPFKKIKLLNYKSLIIIFEWIFEMYNFVYFKNNGTIIDYKIDTTVISETYTKIEYKATIETYDSLHRKYDRREHQTTRETYLDFKNKCYTKYYDVRYEYVEFSIVLSVVSILITIALGIFMLSRIFSSYT